MIDLRKTIRARAAERAQLTNPAPAPAVSYNTQPAHPAVPTALRPAPIVGRPAAAFHEGGHGASGRPHALPEIGSSGSEAHTALRDLHARMKPTYGQNPAPPTLADIHLAKRHAQQTNCAACSAWIAGNQGGVAIQQKLAAQEAARAKQDAAASALERQQPEVYIAKVKSEQSRAAAAEQVRAWKANNAAWTAAAKRAADQVEARLPVYNPKSGETFDVWSARRMQARTLAVQGVLRLQQEATTNATMARRLAQRTR